MRGENCNRLYLRLVLKLHRRSVAMMENVSKAMNDWERIRDGERKGERKSAGEFKKER